MSEFCISENFVVNEGCDVISSLWWQFGEPLALNSCLSELCRTYGRGTVSDYVFEDVWDLDSEDQSAK